MPYKGLNYMNASIFDIPRLKGAPYSSPSQPVSISIYRTNTLVIYPDEPCKTFKLESFRGFCYVPPPTRVRPQEPTDVPLAFHCLTKTGIPLEFVKHVVAYPAVDKDGQYIEADAVSEVQLTDQWTNDFIRCSISVSKFDNYDKVEVCIFDDFAYGHLPGRGVF